MSGRAIHHLEFTAIARRSLNWLPEKVAAAVLEFCSGPLGENPHRVGKPLQREFEGLQVARRGEYRIIYRVGNSARVILVLRVDHRGRIYGAP